MLRLFFHRAFRRALKFGRSRPVSEFSPFDQAEKLGPSVIKRIERVVARVEGGRVRCVQSSSLQGLSSYDPNRRFFIAECLVDGEKKMSLFLKVGRVSRRKYRHIEALSKLSLPIPMFYGVFQENGWTVAIWRYCEGRCLPAFRFFTDADFVAAAKAIATFNVLGLQCPRDINAMKEPMWTAPVAHELMRIMSSDEELLARRDTIACFAYFEDKLLAALISGGQVCLNHNDFKASNMLFLDDGSCQLTDLESSGYGPLGASLRCFSYLSFEKRDLVIASYVEQMRSHGIICTSELVHQVACAQQLLWAFHTGILFNCTKRIIHWLDHFSRLYDVDGDKIFLKRVGEV